LRAPTDCKRSVSGSISLPSSGCFSPFPHGTGSLSVAWEYLGLERGRPMFKQDFSCPALLKDLIVAVSVQGYHPLMPNFPECSGYNNKATGLVRVRSPLLTESLRFPFLRVLRCFNSPRLPQHPMYSGVNTPKGWVSPFGHPGIKALWQLPQAYRSLTRPSSPPCAKASTKRP
jgi:hypothetical protein